MSHKFTDFAKDFEEVMKDPLYPAYAAGFEKAKEIFTALNPGQLAFITSAVDYFLWWKESQDASFKRVDL